MVASADAAAWAMQTAWGSGKISFLARGWSGSCHHFSHPCGRGASSASASSRGGFLCYLVALLLHEGPCSVCGDAAAPRIRMVADVGRDALAGPCSQETTPGPPHGSVRASEPLVGRAPFPPRAACNRRASFLSVARAAWLRVLRTARCRGCAAVGVAHGAPAGSEDGTDARDSLCLIEGPSPWCNSTSRGQEA